MKGLSTFLTHSTFEVKRRLTKQFVESTASDLGLHSFTLPMSIYGPLGISVLTSYYGIFIQAMSVTICNPVTQSWILLLDTRTVVIYWSILLYCLRFMYLFFY